MFWILAKSRLKVDTIEPNQLSCHKKLIREGTILDPHETWYQEVTKVKKAKKEADMLNFEFPVNLCVRFSVSFTELPLRKTYGNQNGNTSYRFIH